MNKKIYRYSEIKEDILEAVDMISDPIIQTLGPRGGNVLYEDDKGHQFVTNDGVTIAKNINVSDPVKDAIIEVIKHSALKTNSMAGDGTSTTILYSKILIKEGLKLVEEGVNQMVLRDKFLEIGEKIKDKLKKGVNKVSGDEDLLFISKISANNDEAIAKDVLKVFKTAGQEGMIFIEPSYTNKTEIVEDTGYMINAGLLSQELITDKGRMVASYQNVPVLITDKQLYYAEEAETILSTCLKNGYKEVVIVAKNFVGEALPFFVANHTQGKIKVLLVKDEAADKEGGISLEDLSTYLGGKVISEKSGSIVDNLKIEDFCLAEKVFADGVKTIISRDNKENNPDLVMLVEALKSKKEKKGDREDAEFKLLQKRLSSLTNGMVTIRVGGSTHLEVRERMFRFEDAVSAVRAAAKDGYLVGGGLAVHRAVKSLKLKDDFGKVFNKLGEANIRQIAENSGLHADTVVETVNLAENENIGYNALSGQYEDLLEAGVVDPYKVAEMCIDNAISIANVICTSRYLIVNEKEDAKS